MSQATTEKPADKPDATTLALERTFLAHERTLMAWVRTGTSLITFGFGVYKFFQFELKLPALGDALIGPRGFGLLMIVFGLVSLVMGTVQQVVSMRRLRAYWPEAPRSVAAVLAVFIAVLGLGALLAAMLKQ